MAKNQNSKGRQGNSLNPNSPNPKPSNVTPFQQLQRELHNPEELTILVENLMPLQQEYRDDLCLSILAYIKFKVPRQFDNRLIQVIYQAYIDMLDENRI